ncbi:MAG: hypothetical protein LBT46_09545, partial [Planctomycetaceae bacterium]|nr:hypothetical protein [Planctomycetaceae bacterium]
DGIQKNIRKPSDNLREIKYLETRVKYFEMRIKYLEEPADREYNAAQLCEVQAKLRELQAGAPQDNSAERNSAERKAAERKAANTKKAAD